METANKLTYLSTKFFTENEEEYRMTVTVSLDDDCHNNMCDWSVTADIRQKNKHGLVEDITGHQWSLNRYENDLLTAGCHRIAYNEMERIAKQLGWV